MTTLFIDTETTGFPDFNKRARDPSQPHIVQFAAILFDGLQEVERFDRIAKPDGWTIPKEASDVHGITTEAALDDGIPEGEIVLRFMEMLSKAKLLVAHNITFDKFIMRCAARRFELLDDSGDEHWKNFPTFCTMRAMENICKLPGKFAGKYKWPKLSEAYEHAFGKPVVGAHDALADVRACADLYFWLQKKGLAAGGFKQERKAVAA